MKCPNCGKEAINVNGRYVCLDCGIELTSAGTPAAQSSNPPEIQNHAGESIPPAITPPTQPNPSENSNIPPLPFIPPTSQTPEPTATPITDALKNALNNDTQEAGTFEFQNDQSNETVTPPNAGSVLPDFPTTTNASSETPQETEAPKSPEFGSQPPVNAFIPPSGTIPPTPNPSTIPENQITADPLNSDITPPKPIEENLPKSDLTMDSSFMATSAAAQTQPEPSTETPNFFQPSSIPIISSSNLDQIQTTEKNPIEPTPVISQPADTVPSTVQPQNPTLNPAGVTTSTQAPELVSEAPVTQPSLPQENNIETDEQVGINGQPNQAEPLASDPLVPTNDDQSDQSTTEESDDDPPAPPSNPGSTPNFPIVNENNGQSGFNALPGSEPPAEEPTPEPEPEPAPPPPPPEEDLGPTENRPPNIDELLQKYSGGGPEPIKRPAVDNFGPSFPVGMESNASPKEYFNVPIPGSGKIPSAESVFGPSEEPGIKKENVFNVNGSRNQSRKLIAIMIVALMIILVGGGVVYGISGLFPRSKPKEAQQQSFDIASAVTKAMDADQNVQVSYEQKLDFSAVTQKNVPDQSIQDAENLKLLLSKTLSNKGNWQGDSAGNLSLTETSNGKKYKKIYLKEENSTYSYSNDTNLWTKIQEIDVTPTPEFYNPQTKGGLFYPTNNDKISSPTDEVIDGTTYKKYELTPKSDLLRPVISQADKLLGPIFIESIDATKLNVTVWVDSNNKIFRVEIKGSIDVKSDYFDGTVGIDSTATYKYDSVKINKPVTQ